MKKFSSFFAAMFLIAIVAVFFVSCNKDLGSSKDQTTVSKNYVSSVVGSFIPKEGDITLKNANLTKVTRTWTMLTNNSAFYPSGVWSLVTGKEFIANSAAYNFWSVSTNNPASFPAETQVYSNLTPDEDLRCILETKNLANEVVYLGIVDFKPSKASFPMTVNGFRLGDVLTINADKLFNLPGGNRIAITATFKLSKIDLTATKAAVLTGTSTTPAGKQFQWSDVVYGLDESMLVNVGAGTVTLYDGLAGKVKGEVIITVTDNGSPLTGPTGGYSVKVDLSNQSGKGHALTLNTTKIGWYDSDFITFSDTNITVDNVPVDVN
jgi:hypothetical protein